MKDEEQLEKQREQQEKLLDSPTKKAWYRTMQDITVTTYDGEINSYPRGVHVLISKFEGDTATIEQPVHGWTYVYNDDSDFLFEFYEVNLFSCPPHLFLVHFLLKQTSPSESRFKAKVQTTLPSVLQHREYSVSACGCAHVC